MEPEAILILDTVFYWHTILYMIEEPNDQHDQQKAGLLFDAIYDVQTAQAAVKGLNPSEIINILSNRHLSPENVFRVLGASPMWAQHKVGREILETSAQAIVESVSDESEIPEDIRMMVRAWVKTILA